MIQKVLPSEYLQGYEKMTDKERETYRRRVGEWMSSDGARLLEMTDRPMAKSQNLMLMGIRWSKDDCRAVYEGMLLLTALMGQTDTWLPAALFAKSAWRAVRKICSELSAVQAANHQEKTVKHAQATGSAKQENKSGNTNANSQTAGSAVNIQSAKSGKSEGTQTDKQDVANQPTARTDRIPARPKHIDQYVHLLPKATQERAAKVKGLLREMDETRETMRMMMGRVDVSAQVMANLSTAVSKIDKELRYIYDELDREWKKLAESGRIALDELGHAHIVDAPQDGTAQDTAPSVKPAETGSPKRGRKPMTDEEKAAKAAEREKRRKAERQRKASLIRKWLIDTRNAKTDEQKEKWLQRYREMVAIGGEQTVTKKVTEAAAFYGISLEEAQK